MTTDRRRAEIQEMLRRISEVRGSEIEDQTTVEISAELKEHNARAESIYKQLRALDHGIPLV